MCLLLYSLRSPTSLQGPPGGGASRCLCPGLLPWDVRVNNHKKGFTIATGVYWDTSHHHTRAKAPGTNPSAALKERPPSLHFSPYGGYLGKEPSPKALARSEGRTRSASLLIPPQTSRSTELPVSWSFNPLGPMWAQLPAPTHLVKPR